MVKPREIPIDLVFGASVRCTENKRNAEDAADSIAVPNIRPVIPGPTGRNSASRPETAAIPSEHNKTRTVILL